MTPKPRKPHNQGLSEITVVPLIDVSLVLVLMLLLATPLAFESSIAVRRAAPSSDETQAPDVDRWVVLHVVSEQDVQIDGQTVTRREISQTLRPLFAQGRSMVVVSCADPVSHGTFVDVLDQAKLCGAAEIAVTGR